MYIINKLNNYYRDLAHTLNTINPKKYFLSKYPDFECRCICNESLTLDPISISIFSQSYFNESLYNN